MKKMYVLTKTSYNDRDYPEYYYMSNVFIGITESWESVYSKLENYVRGIRECSSNEIVDFELYFIHDSEEYDEIRQMYKYSVGELRYYDKDQSYINEIFVVYEYEV